MSTPPGTILFVHPSDELYGSDRCLLEIVRNLPDGSRAIVVLPTDIQYRGALSSELARHGARVVHVNMLVLRRNLLLPANLPRLLWRALTGTWSLARLIRRERVSIVHSNTVAVVCGAIAATITRTPHVWHVHEFLGDEPGAFRVVLRTMLGWIPGRIIANSKAVARSIVAGNRRRARKTRVIYNGVTLNATSQRGIPRAHDGPITIGIVGRLAPRKGIDEALRATAVLVESGSDIRLRLTGSPPPGQEERLNGYRRRARELNIDELTTFTGYQRVDTALQGIDILLVPSQRPEPFGLVLIEGMAAGIPVIASRNGGGSDEILHDGVTGIYCGHEPKAIADAIERLVRNPELRSKIAANAVEAAAARFSMDRYVGQILDEYARLTVSNR